MKNTKQNLKTLLSKNRDKKNLKEIISNTKITSDKKLKKIPNNNNSKYLIHQENNNEYRNDIIPFKKIENYSQRSINANNKTKPNEMINSKENNFIRKLDEKRSHSLKKNNISNYNMEEKNNTKKNFNYNENNNNNYNKNINDIQDKNILKNIINILLYYIKVLNNQIDVKFKKVFVEKIKKLKIENNFLLKENKNLKSTIFKIIYTIKSYENKENIYLKNNQKFLTQLFEENIYLRKENYNTSNIKGDYLIQYNKDINKLKEKIKNDLIIQKKKEEINNNQIEVQNNEEENPFSFLNKNSSDKEINKNFHKRQRTHINLNNINEINANDKQNNIVENNKSNISINTIVHKSEENSTMEEEINYDAFSNTLIDMTNNNKIEKSNNSTKNLFDYENYDSNNKNSLNNQLNLSNKKQPIFYRTPKDKKKIDFNQ